MSYSPYTNAAQAYKRQEVLNATPGKLILLLYEGAIGSLERAKIELETPGQERSARIGEALGKAMAILGELRAALDHEVGGEITQNLDALYEFCQHRIFNTNVERQAETVRAAIKVLKTLKEGWDAVIPA